MASSSGKWIARSEKRHGNEIMVGIHDVDVTSERERNGSAEVFPFSKATVR